MVKNTIAAISTGLTNSGIGKVRMSGSQAIEIADRVYKSPKGKKKLSNVESHTIHYGYIYDDDRLIDEVLVLVMRAPKSYTTEDMVEIDCHGGVVVMKKILETLIRHGARPAEPGEFTKRAFLNGRIDLTQAEAVIDVIQAKNEYALESSVKQLRGSVFHKIKEIRQDILNQVAFIEAAMDDPEHISADHFGEELSGRVKDDMKALQKLLDSADNGRLLKEGIRTVIVGKPNAGKSSLLNVLVGDERAIVTDIAGTTRDTLEESILVHGIPLNIVDTAGIRDTEDVVEKIGVSKAKSFAQDADLIIYVVDGSTPLDENDGQIIEMIKDKKAIVLLNKIDLNLVTTKAILEEKTSHPVVEISARNTQRSTVLEGLLKDMFFEGRLSFNDEIYITSARHKAALLDAMESLSLVQRSIDDGMPEDFFSIDLMNACEALEGLPGNRQGRT